MLTATQELKKSAFSVQTWRNSNWKAYVWYRRHYSVENELNLEKAGDDRL
jgi:hypothetical protein